MDILWNIVFHFIYHVFRYINLIPNGHSLKPLFHLSIMFSPTLISHISSKLKISYIYIKFPLKEWGRKILGLKIRELHVDLEC